MTGTLLLQSALAGLTNGFVYALVGLGLAVIFRGTRIINAMQGEFALVGGVAAYLLIDSLGFGLPWALLAGVVAGGALGWWSSSHWCARCAGAAAAKKATCC